MASTAVIPASISSFAKTLDRKSLQGNAIFRNQRIRFNPQNLRLTSRQFTFSSPRIICSSNSNEVAVTSNQVPENVNSENSSLEIDEDLDISESSVFLGDIANLVKLVDTRDIVELELKHKDFEIVIKKRESQPQPPRQSFPGPHILAHTPYPEYMIQPSVVQPPPQSASPPPATAPVESAPPAQPAPPPSSTPPMASPMSGTFYRCPAPGEPAFVKEGDTVKKGQVVCIIEAMKLMNEIEADRNGTITSILIGDGKPVGIGTPLFAINP